MSPESIRKRIVRAHIVRFLISTLQNCKICTYFYKYIIAILNCKCDAAPFMYILRHSAHSFISFHVLSFARFPHFVRPFMSIRVNKRRKNDRNISHFVSFSPPIPSTSPFSLAPSSLHRCCVLSSLFVLVFFFFAGYHFKALLRSFTLALSLYIIKMYINSFIRMALSGCGRVWCGGVSDGVGLLLVEFSCAFISSCSGYIMRNF